MGGQSNSADKIKDQQWKVPKVGEFIAERVSRIRGDLENEELPDLCTRVIDSFERSIIELLPERRDKLSLLMGGIREISFSSSQELAETITRRVTEFIVSKVPLDELEKGIRDYNVRALGWTMVGRVLGYQIEGDKIAMRVPQVFLRDPREAPVLFLRELKKLAKILSSDPKLADIKAVYGKSSLIFSGRFWLQDRGFTITGVDNEERVATAEISTKELIELYPSN